MPDNALHHFPAPRPTAPNRLCHALLALALCAGGTLYPPVHAQIAPGGGLFQNQINNSLVFPGIFRGIK